MRVITPIEIISETAFSRASTATYYDEDGILQTAAIDELRLNHNPETLESEGILIEGEATNLALYSETLSFSSGSVWARSAVTIPSGAVNYNGVNMYKVVASNSLVAHFLDNLHATLSDNQIFSASIFAARGEYSKCEFIIIAKNGSGTLIEYDFDLGLVTQSQAGTGQTGIIFGVEKISGGLVRLKIENINALSGATTPRFRAFVVDGTGVQVFSGGGDSGTYFGGAQLEVGGSVSSYTPTGATAVTRAADMLGDMVTSTVAEPDTGEVLWNAANSYAIDDVVIRTTTHKKYINIQAGVNATLPEVDAALDEPTRWIETGSTNRFAMFDTLRNTQTETTSPLSVVLVPGNRVNSIGILAMEAEEITIRVANGYEEIYTYTENLNTREVLSWYDYFFEPFSNTAGIVKYDLPPFTAGNITITLTSTTGTVKCGAVIIGNNTDLGRVEYGARVSGTNFSRIEREFDGTAVLVQRQTKPKVNGTTFFNKNQTNKILAIKQTLNAVPTVWSGLDDDNTDGYFDGLLILGIYKLFDVDIAYPENAKLDFEIEEL
jgi:hypothetical protein